MQRNYGMLWLGLGAVAVVIIIGTGLPGGFSYGVHPLGGWMWGAGWLFGPLLWVGIIGLGILLWQRDRAPINANPRRTRSAAVEHLEWRYAAGQISREQYDEMRAVLEPEHVRTGGNSSDR
jgi:uncharacterized membrane protein